MSSAKLSRWFAAFLAGLLLFSLGDAVINGGRPTWLTVAVMALVLAFHLWVDARTKDKNRPPT